MALDFPTAPTIGQKYPASPVAGVPQYNWDGEKWTTFASSPTGKQALYTEGGQTITGGFRFTPYNQAPGSFTVNPLNGNYQWLNNNGAFTITAPAVDCAVDILVINGATAGAITMTGFTVGSNVGDAMTNTNGHRFIWSIRRINGISTYVIKALQ
jgi:hypothetical protein